MGLRFTRREGEAFLLPGGIRVQYIGQNGRNQACINVEAPRNVTILREEIATAHDRVRMGHDPNPPEGVPRRRRDGSIADAWREGDDHA